MAASASSFTLQGMHQSAQMVTGNDESTIKKHQLLSVEGNRDTKVTGDRSRSGECKPDYDHWQGQQHHHRRQPDDRHYQGCILSIDGGLSETVGKDRTISVAGGVSETVQKNVRQTFNEDLGTTVGGSVTLVVKDKWTEGIADGKNVAVPPKKKIQISADDEVVLQAGSAQVKLSKNGDIVIKGGKITVEGSSDVKVTGSKVTIN